MVHAAVTWQSTPKISQMVLRPVQQLVHSFQDRAATAAGPKYCASRGYQAQRTPRIEHQSAQAVQEPHQVQPVVLGESSPAGLSSGQRLVQGWLAAAAWVQAGHLLQHLPHAPGAMR